MTTPKYISHGDNYIIADKAGKEFLLSIVMDEDAMSPRDWDNVGTMCCWHRRYDLGDKHEFSDGTDLLLTLATGLSANDREDAETIWWDEHDETEPYDNPEDWSKKEVFGLINEKYAILPLWLYDHSGITMSCGDRSYPYNCPFDSGQVGWIFVSKEKAFKEFGTRDDAGNPLPLTEENWREEAEKRLETEVDVFNHYITGNVFDYKIYEIGESGEVGEIIDSCYGFYGSAVEDNGLFDHLGDYTFVQEADINTETTTRTFIERGVA